MYIFNANIYTREFCFQRLGGGGGGVHGPLSPKVVPSMPTTQSRGHEEGMPWAVPVFMR